MAISVKNVIMVVVSLVVIAVVLPLGIGLISAMGDASVTVNGTAYLLSELADPTVITLLTILLPILAVIGIILAFIPRGGE